VSLEKAMQYIKGSFSFRLKSSTEVWQRSYDNRRILGAEDFSERIRYIDQNPVRAHIATRAEEYLFSSAGRIDLIDPPPHHLSLWAHA
jgi:putative transposase